MVDLVVTADQSTRRLPESVRDRLATDLADDATEVGGAVLDTIRSFTNTALGLVPPESISFVDLQDAADAAAAAGTRFVAAGTITTDQTLVIISDADLGGLTYNYNGSGVAVQIGNDASGSGSVIREKEITTPRVINVSKVGTGWTGSTTGIKVINTLSCRITVKQVRGFVTGLHLLGQGTGLVHTTFDLRHLQNNKRNLWLDVDSSGWCNQNLFLGGQLSHESAEGSNVSGVRHILFTDGPTYPINNNTFVNTSVEYETPEYHVDLSGLNNMFMNCRWESVGGARVRYQAGAIGNTIFYGNSARNIVFTTVSGAIRNHVYTDQSASTPRSGADVHEHTSSSATPFEYALEAGGVSGGSTPSTAYAISRSAQRTNMKRGTDAAERLALDHQNGRVYFGGGSTTPTIYLGLAGSNLSVAGVPITTSATAGAASALPGVPVGYMTLYIDGAARKIPYWN